MSPEVEQAIEAISWSIAATIVSQIVSIVLMWMLGVRPRKLAKEINDVQNPAIGASFFIVALTMALFIGIFASDGFSDPSNRELRTTLVWGALALFLGLVLMWASFVIAHRIMGVENEESTYRYIQRELVEEQNIALALFLGGLVLPPFIVTIFQVI